MSSPLPERIGKYVILDRIGSGGMGHVYLARDSETSEQVAVKVLTAGLAREEGFVERFNREIDAMRKLSHPNIVAFRDYGVDGESYYFAMEYVAGETLLSMLRRIRRIPWRSAFNFSIQICRALKAAHDQGIIHRDLKPSNLLIDSAGKVHLTDFGVAQVFDTQRLTVTGGVIGTAEYMSPEQAEGKRAGKQSDLYSLGIVLYVMVTGRTPFSGNSTVEVLQKQRFGLFDTPRAIVRDLPLRVDETICRLLEKDPQKRFPDAFVLARHLESILAIENELGEGSTINADLLLEGDNTTSGAASAPDYASRPTAEILVNAGQATLMKGLIRAELDALNRVPGWMGWFHTAPGLFAALVGLSVSVWWLWPRPLTAEQRFEQGVQLMQQGEGLNYLQARREFFEPLLENSPDVWSERVNPYLREIELYQLQREARGRRRSAKNSRSDGVDGAPRRTLQDDEPSRLVRRALELQRTGDQARSGQLLKNLRRLLQDDTERQGIRELVDRLLEDLKPEEQVEKSQEYLQETIARAEVLRARGDAAGAAELLAALRNAYADLPEIRDQIPAE